MGEFFGKAIEKVKGKKQIKILMTGLDAAGKTTILYKLKLGEVVTTIPTIGMFKHKLYYLCRMHINTQKLIKPPTCHTNRIGKT